MLHRIAFFLELNVITEGCTVFKNITIRVGWIITSGVRGFR